MQRRYDTVLRLGGRFRLGPVIVSLLCSAGLWFWGMSLSPAVHRGSYAVLVFNEAVPEREVTARLESQGITGIVSESRQWFFLDRFGSVEQIPLDEAGRRLLPFDPRNDGYADKIRQLFIQDGKHLVYIPMDFTGAAYNARIAAAMGDIPYSFEYAVSHEAPFRPSVLMLLLFCFSSCVFVVFRPLRVSLRFNAARLLPCLPVLTPLSMLGAAGFALAALLAGFAVALAVPRLERVALMQRREQPRWVVPAVLLGCCSVIAVFSGLPVVFSLASTAVFCGVFSLSFWSASRSAGDTEGILGAIGAASDFPGKYKSPLFSPMPGRQRFSPVTIISRRNSNYSFSWAMIPYALVALVLALAGFAMPGEPDYHPNRADFSVLPSGITVTEEDYYSHFLFQAAFSHRSLHASSLHDSPPAMSVFQLAPDGLPDLAFFEFVDESLLDNIPQFPLGSLLLELDSPGNWGSSEAADSVPPGLTLLFSLLPLIFIFPCLFARDPAPKILKRWGDEYLVKSTTSLR